MDEDSNPIGGSEGENTGSIEVEEMNGQSPSGSQGAEIKWSGKVGEQLRRDEQCIFKTVGYVFCSFSTSREGNVDSLKKLIWSLFGFAES